MESKIHTWLEKARKNAGWLVVFGVLELVAGTYREDVRIRLR